MLKRRSRYTTHYIYSDPDEVSIQKLGKGLSCYYGLLKEEIKEFPVLKESEVKKYDESDPLFVSIKGEKVRFEDLTTKINCTGFALGVANFSQVKKSQYNNRESAEEYLKNIGLSINRMENQLVVFWPHNTRSGDFHWGKCLADGRWAEKRGSTGIYIWDNLNYMKEDCKRIGYIDPIECSFNSS